MRPASGTSGVTHPRFWIPLALILAFGGVLRLHHVGDPFLDAHRWRQVDTAAIARNLYEGSLNPLYPSVDWGGPVGHVEAEFPLVPWFVALAYRLFGFHEVLGRLVVIAFSLALIAVVARLTIALDGRPAVALAAAFLVAISPAAVFFGRTLMPDTPMLFFSALAVLGFVEYGRLGSQRWLVAGSVGLGLACLVKIPAAAVVPALVVALAGGSVPWWRDRRVWLALAVPAAVTIAWYWHAHAIFERTGLTFGILDAPAKTYPVAISPGPWPSVFSKWSTWALLSDWMFYERLLARLYHFVLLPVGVVTGALGALVWRGRGRWVALAWLAALIMFVLVAGEGNRAHDYYQLPFVVVGAVYFGVIAWPLFDREWRQATWGLASWKEAAFVLVLGATGFITYYYSGVTQTHFRSDRLDVRILQAGQALDAVTEDRALAVVVDDYGVTSPLLFYFSHLKGWSFDPGDVSPELLARLNRRGARYFATSQWSEIARLRAETARVLEQCVEVPLTGAPADTRLFELGCVR